MRRRRTQPIMYMPRDAKVNEAQPKTMEQILGEKIIALEAELAALKEKSRWRKQSEEPPLKYGHNVEVYSPISNQVRRMLDTAVPEYCYWRPLDLPEMEGREE